MSMLMRHVRERRASGGRGEQGARAGGRSGSWLASKYPSARSEFRAAAGSCTSYPEAASLGTIKV